MQRHQHRQIRNIVNDDPAPLNIINILNDQPRDLLIFCVILMALYYFLTFTILEILALKSEMSLDDMAVVRQVWSGD